MKVKVSQSCRTPCDPMDCSPPGFSVHGIPQARILEWVAISFSRGSSHPGTEPGSTILQADFLLTEPPGLFVWGIRSKIGKGVVRVIHLGVGLYLLVAVAVSAKVIDFLSRPCLLS